MNDPRYLVQIKVSEVLTQDNQHQKYSIGAIDGYHGQWAQASNAENVRGIAQGVISTFLFYNPDANLSDVVYKVHGVKGDHPQRDRCDWSSHELPVEPWFHHPEYTATPDPIVLRGIEILLQDPEVIAAAREKARQKAA